MNVVSIVTLVNLDLDAHPNLDTSSSRDGSLVRFCELVVAIFSY
jgi:hypothetical protein